MVAKKVKEQIRNFDLQKVLIGLGALFIIAAGVIYFTQRGSQTANEQEPEQVFIEDNGAVKRQGEEEQELSEQEAEEIRQEVQAVLEGDGVEKSALTNEAGAEKGSVKRAFSDGRYYLMASVSNLETLSKGYFYGAWLTSEEKEDIFVGRVGYTQEKGTLYYLDNRDLTDYQNMIITKEPENGDEVIGETIVSASF